MTIFILQLAGKIYPCNLSLILPDYDFENSIWCTLFWPIKSKLIVVKEKQQNAFNEFKSGYNDSNLDPWSLRWNKWDY